MNAEVPWTIELRRCEDSSLGRRQVRVFHYGELVDNRWIREWEYPQNTEDTVEEFYICVTPDQLLEEEDTDIPREDRGGNVGLLIAVTEPFDNGGMPYVDLYYITQRHHVADDADEEEEMQTVLSCDYEVRFAYLQEFVG